MGKKSRKGNLGKPLPASTVRGLMRAMMSLSPSPIGAPARPDPGASGDLIRAWSNGEIADLASRILKRAQDGKEVRLRPATAKLVADALLRMNAAVTNQQLLEIVCGSKRCGFRSDNHNRFCFQCHAKVNVIMARLRGEREYGVG